MAYGHFDLADLLLSDNDYTSQYRDALRAWKARPRGAIQEDIGLVPGIIFHLWHGPLTLRVFGCLPVTARGAVIEAGVRKASKEETAGEYASAAVSVYGDLRRGCARLGRSRTELPA